MKQQMIKIEKALDTLSMRDQVALFVTILAIVIIIWSKLIYQPLSDSMMVVQRDVFQKESEIKALQAKLLVLQNNIDTDPDTENRQQLEQYLQESAKLDEALATSSVQIINPQEMSSLLEQLLREQTGLKFVSMKNKPATPEFIQSHNDSESVDNVNTVYRHSVVLQMEGSYHNTLSYLKKLEQLPWRFFWQGVEVEVDDYPNALITLEVYTLGFREGVIGV